MLIKLLFWYGFVHLSYCCKLLFLLLKRGILILVVALEHAMHEKFLACYLLVFSISFNYFLSSPLLLFLLLLKPELKFAAFILRLYPGFILLSLLPCLLYLSISLFLRSSLFFSQLIMHFLVQAHLSYKPFPFLIWQFHSAFLSFFKCSWYA